MKFDGWALLIVVAISLYFAVEFHLWRKERRTKKENRDAS